MTYKDVINRLDEEKNLVACLTQHLEKELEYITQEDIESLEESMPEKQKLLQRIAANREGRISPQGDPEPHHADQIRTLQQELVTLWKKASGLNELSKSMISGRLVEIEHQLEPFFAEIKKGYNSSGEKSGIFSRTLKTGV